MREMPKGIVSNLCSVAAVLFILLSDQISKYVVVQTLYAGDSVYVLPFFNIVRVENKGVTFGLLNGTVSQVILMFISLLVMAFLCLWLKNNRRYRFLGSLIIGGAIGNLMDRIIYGAVIDFLDFHLLTYHWPAFNIADSAIVVGGTAVFFMSCREESK